MKFTVNPVLWQNVFVVPSAVADENLRTASALQLKVLLWFLKNNMQTEDLSSAAKALIVSEEEINDALMFWTSRGVLIPDEPSKVVESSLITQNESKPQGKPATDVNKSDSKINSNSHTAAKAVARMQKPTVAEVIKRGEQSADVRYLLAEAQRKLGRTLSPNDMQTLVWLFDYCSMPASVILMITEYAVSSGKGNMRYIESLTLAWSDEGVSTIGQAEKKILEMRNIDSAWIKLQKLFGIEQRKPTKYEEGFADRVINKWKFDDDIIVYAYDECIDHIGKYKATYINKVLQRLYDEKITTVEQLEKAQLNVEESMSNNSDDEYTNVALKGPRRRKKS